MSTSFGILPIKMDKHLTFGNVVEAAEKTMNDFLQSYEITTKVTFSIELRDNDENYENKVSPDDKFIWKDTEHAWFTIDQVKTGGIEAYCNQLSETLDYWPEYVEEKCGELIDEKLAETIKKYNIKYYVNRSPGQTPLIQIGYGHIAAAIAKMSEGIIYSVNGWDPSMMPTDADKFAGFYFRPEKTEHEPSRIWSEKCLNKIRPPKKRMQLQF
ncbi:MAG: hypothetical protein IPP77_06990 [Bacteroidetes bacterium]|nr:hypothetical protein [Bacteroidota bacterium]